VPDERAFVTQGSLALRQRRNRLWLLTPPASAALCWLAAIFAALPIFAALLALLATVGSVFVFIFTPGKIFFIRLEALAANRFGVFEDGRCVLSGAAIRSVLRQAPRSLSESWRVRVRTRWGTERIYVLSSETEAIEFSEALGFDESSARASFRYDGPALKRNMRSSVLSYYFVVCIVAVLGGLLAVAALGAFGVFVAAAAFLFLAVLPWAPSTANVGADGIELHYLWKRTLIPFSNIAAVTRRPYGIELSQTGSRSNIFIHVSPTSLGGNEADLLFPRLHRAWQLSRVGASRDDVRAALEQLDANDAGVIEQLRSLTTSGGIYRGANVDTESLADLALDGSAPPALRVKATIAALASGSEALRARFRVAANTCVNEDLRAALEDEADAAQLRQAIRRQG
jgi:hypothetical protein